MTEPLLELVRDAMASPWIPVIILAIAALDAFFPLVPSESVVISAGVFAAQGSPDLWIIVAAAALGAFAGDHLSYAIGRRAGPRVIDWAAPGTRRRTALDRAARMLAVRGGLILVTARYVPGGRTAVTLTAGAVRYPCRLFSPFAAVAAVTWGLYSALVGYLGGLAFEQQPLKGVLLGVGLALGVSLVVEAVRFARTRGESRTADERSSTVWITAGDKVPHV